MARRAVACYPGGMERRRPWREGERGFALLIVLWTLGLLALIVAQLTAGGRSEAQIAANLRANATAEAAADGGVNNAVLQLLGGRWAADGSAHELRIGAAVVVVRAADQIGKINPNATTAGVLQALMVNLGVPPARAGPLSRAIIDWRTPSGESISGGEKLTQYRAAGLPYGPANRPFESLDEIGLVVGMTQDVLDRIKPFLSVYQEGTVQRSANNSLALDSLDDAKAKDARALIGSFTSHNLIAAITATATTPDGGRFTRRAVVRLKGAPQGDELPYEILTWTTGAD
jgi:general secretion pathway protein K